MRGAGAQGRERREEKRWEGEVLKQRGCHLIDDGRRVGLGGARAEKRRFTQNRGIIADP